MDIMCTELKKEPETKLEDFRFLRFNSFTSFQKIVNTVFGQLTEEERHGEIVIGFIPKNAVLQTKEQKNPFIMKRVLFYKGSPEQMQNTIQQSGVPLNGVKKVWDLSVHSKVIEYKGKCSFCNFLTTEDNSLLCYSCIKTFNDCKKLISPEEETDNNV